MDQNYSLTFKLGNPDKDGFRKLYLKFYTPGNTIHLEYRTIKLLSNQFDPKKKKKSPIVNHPNATEYNRLLDNFRIEVENRAIKAVGPITKDYLMGNVSSSDRLVDFIEDFVREQRKINENSGKITSRGSNRAKGRFSDGRLRLYEVMKGKVMVFDKKANFRQINADWLKRFESHLITTDIGGSTLSSNMSVIKAIIGHAAAAKLLPKSQYEGYIPPEYEDDIPVFLEEHEILSFHTMVETIADPTLKTSGYYFLLACYAGYRISDLKTFDYEERVKAGYVVLRAKKNGTIVSIPAYGRLPDILEYCRLHKLMVTEETMRKHVRLICGLIGIKNRKVTPHSGRHSFAMRLTDRGLGIDDVAELLGDSKRVAERYARIRNVPLANRVKKIMGE